MSNNSNIRLEGPCEIFRVHCPGFSTPVVCQKEIQIKAKGFMPLHFRRLYYQNIIIIKSVKHFNNRPFSKHSVPDHAFERNVRMKNQSDSNMLLARKLRKPITFEYFHLEHVRHGKVQNVNKNFLKQKCPKYSTLPRVTR